MNINPDRVVVFKAGPLSVNETIFFTWVVMAVMTIASMLITRNLSTGPKVSRWQGILETLVVFLEGQIREVTGIDPRPFMPFLGTLFVFILTANIMEVVPLFHPPTSSLSTTAALAVSVFFAVPVFGIMNRGVIKFAREYLEPSFVMLPFNIISEVTRPISLSVRLFGHIMSESHIGGVLLSIVPLFVPVVMQAFGLIIGSVQAFIFFTLATVYIGSAAGNRAEEKGKEGG
jgi:F-type H+-transporting ATPase subunit a